MSYVGFKVTGADPHGFDQNGKGCGAEASPTPTVPPMPTPVPQPTVYQEADDAIVDITKPDPSGLAIAYIRGNAAGRHFAITSYDANNQYIALLVNTTEPYDGIVPLDFFDDEQTARLEVKAVGDDVFPVQGDLDTAHISGNQGSRHFAVEAFSADGYDLLVNTTNPYGGQVLVPGGNFTVFAVSAVGEWTITFEEHAGTMRIHPYAWRQQRNSPPVQHGLPQPHELRQL